MENLNEEEKVLQKIGKKISKEKNDNIIYTSFLETEKYILEEVQVTTHTTYTTYTTDIQFLSYTKKSGSTELLHVYQEGEKEFRPIIDKLLDNKVILLPSGIEEYTDNKTLIEDISKFLYTYFEVSPFFEKFLPYLVLFYWVYERFPFVPYIHFVGLTGTGKTTAEEVLGSICYKPIDASGSITMSPIFRTASLWKGTLLLDEFEPDGESYKEMLAFLKSGVSNKAVLRTEGENKREVMAYMIKCPKIFTSENPINNAGLQSRTIMIQMEKNKKRIPLYRLGSFLSDAQKLRNKLLLWRFRNLNNINLNEIEFGYKELENFDRRVQQVITPIYYLSDESTRLEIVKFAKVQEEETQKERLESLDGQVFQIIVDNYPTQSTLKQITEVINRERNKSRLITERKIGSIVRKILGFEIQRLGDENVSTIILDNKEDRLKELCLYFGIPVERVVSVVSVGYTISEPSEAQNDTTHKIVDWNDTTL